jgi:hypothetical protein
MEEMHAKRTVLGRRVGWGGICVHSFPDQILDAELIPCHELQWPACRKIFQTLKYRNITVNTKEITMHMQEESKVTSCVHFVLFSYCHVKER